MKAILINSYNRTVTEVELDHSLEQVYKTLSVPDYPVKYIEAIQIDGLNNIFVDEEGLLKQPEHFFIIRGEANSVPIAGTGLVCGFNSNGKTVDTTLTVSHIKSMIKFADAATVRLLFGSVD